MSIEKSFFSSSVHVEDGLARSLSIFFLVSKIFSLLHHGGIPIVELDGFLRRTVFSQADVSLSFESVFRIRDETFPNRL
jgi:hypothetical protein